jgi:hypothetical protein
MVAGLAVVIEVQIVENHVVWRAHFCLQVQGNIYETQMTSNSQVKNIQRAQF